MYISSTDDDDEPVVTSRKDTEKRQETAKIHWEIVKGASGVDAP